MQVIFVYVFAVDLFMQYSDRDRVLLCAAYPVCVYGFKVFMIVCARLAFAHLRNVLRGGGGGGEGEGGEYDKGGEGGEEQQQQGPGGSDDTRAAVAGPNAAGTAAAAAYEKGREEALFFFFHDLFFTFELFSFTIAAVVYRYAWQFCTCLLVYM